MEYAQDIWTKTIAILEQSLGMSATTIATWFDDVRAISFSENLLTLVVPKQFKKDIIEAHYTKKIQEALQILFSVDIDCKILTQEEFEKDGPVSAEAIDDEYSFERFVVGASNKFAHAAAKAVANAPASSYNPLFIYGGSGLGKTHLLYAIAGTIRKNNPNAEITYVKGDDFTNEMVGHLQAGKAKEFRSKYRNSDLFLVDDIQFIAGKESTQEEFFHTFNTLYEAKKQIVLTSDRLPMAMVNLEERLRTRFESGLMADIQPPDYETRMAIINLKCKRIGLELAQPLKEIIANNVTSNIRQLEGTIKKVLAYRDLLDHDITQETIEHAIKDMFQEHPGLNPTPEIIIKEVSKYYQVDELAIIGKNRSKETVLPRQVSMYLIRELIQSSYPDIGKSFGNRDHSTVIHAVNKIEDAIKKNDKFKNEIKDIRNNILES